MDKIFERDKYYFGKENKLSLVRSLDEKIRLRNEISKYLNELDEFNIKIKDLEKKSPDDKTRNLLINIAYYFSNEINWIDKLYKTRELPIGNLSRDIRISKITIEKWGKHLIAYILLISNNEFKLIREYLDVKEIIDVNESKAIINIEQNEDNNMYRGIVLRTKGRSQYILTADGQVKYIKSNEQLEIGEDAIGPLKKKLKDYRKHMLITLGIIVAIVMCTIYIYKRDVNVVIINSSIKLKLKVNTLGKTIYTYSETETGKKLLEDSEIKHKGIDEGLKYILEYMKENEIYPDGKLSIIISGKKSLDSKYLEEVKLYINENNLPVIINNNGIEYNLK